MKTLSKTAIRIVPRFHPKNPSESISHGPTSLKIVVQCLVEYFIFSILIHRKHEVHDARLLFSESILKTSVPRYFLKVSWTGLSKSIGKLTPFWLSEQKAKRTKVKVSLKSSPLSLSKWEMYVECNSSIWRMGWIAWVQSATVVFVCYRPWFFFFLFVISCYSWKL